MEDLACARGNCFVVGMWRKEGRIATTQDGDVVLWCVLLDHREERIVEGTVAGQVEHDGLGRFC